MSVDRGHISNFQSWFDRIPGLVGINEVLRVGALGEFNSVNALSATLRAQLYSRDKSVFYQLFC